MKKLREHLKIIHRHRRYVNHFCFKMGIPFRGLTHDLSKYSKTEMQIAKYYTGTCSPHDEARAKLGYSPSWYHHKNKNKHHWEYWVDFNGGYFNSKGEFVIAPIAVKMPYKYVIEMFCDFIGAGMAYEKTKWTTKSPITYYLAKCKGQRLMHKNSEKLLVDLLTNLSQVSSVNEFIKWYKKHKTDLKNNY